MRMQVRARGLVLGAALFCLAPAASAVTIDWVSIGNPGNAADNTGYGAVGYAYSIDKYEVTNAQYAEFLNVKAASDPLGLYNTSMGSGFGGITSTTRRARTRRRPVRRRPRRPTAPIATTPWET